MSTFQICSKLKPLIRSSSITSVLQRPIASPNYIISRLEQPARSFGGGCNGNNITLRTFSSLFSSNLPDSLFHDNQLQLQHRSLTTICTRSGFDPAANANTTIAGSHISARTMASLNQMHRTGPFIKKRKRPRPTDGRPQMKGVVIKTFVKKPKKPNSANRKCVRVRLSNGREAIAYIPREGHTLQEHSVVLVRPGNVQDLPGVSLKCVRGKYDLGHVIKK